MASKIADHFDALIIGSGLEGVLKALHLQKQGLKVGLIDSGERNLVPRFPTCLPVTEKTEQALIALKEFLPELMWQSSEITTQCLEGGEFRPFVGFGKHVPAADEVWAREVITQQYVLNKPVEQLITELSSLFTGATYLRSEITAVEMADDRVDTVQVNGKTWLKAATYYVCGPLVEVLNSKLGMMVPARTRQKWSKAETWASVGLYLQHPAPVAEGVYLLQGGGEDINPCLGQVQPEHSVWLGLIPNESVDDYDLVYQELKKVKRLIKRAFPQLFEATTQPKEVLVVQKGSHGWLEDENPGEISFAAIANVTFMMAQLWPGTPLESALAAGFGSQLAQFLCAPDESMLTPSQL